MPKLSNHIIPFGSTPPIFYGVGTRDIARVIIVKVIGNIAMTDVILLSIEKVYAPHARMIMFLSIGSMYTLSTGVESNIMKFLTLFQMYRMLLCFVLTS